ncbi:hypothetical protein D9758_001434 [Tetrapyrgos nigripes]|uniref:sphingolipid C(9)-methyltransferase n=1 Tax=Tetrapyrgos nigripes TaxID=182062 RepID=A0A8H5GS00_9AGAR|nr:hypothetical protein D9758_001434 [Tetrapyrgos nigripes]
MIFALSSTIKKGFPGRNHSDLNQKLVEFVKRHCLEAWAKTKDIPIPTSSRPPPSLSLPSSLIFTVPTRSSRPSKRKRLASKRDESDSDSDSNSHPAKLRKTQKTRNNINNELTSMQFGRNPKPTSIPTPNSKSKSRLSLALVLRLHKYIFPGADASWLGHFSANERLFKQLQSANFEVKNIHVLSVYYSATLYRWVSNKDKIAAKYGDKWYRLWAFFLARSTIISQQGSCSVFQITLHKNLNVSHCVKAIESHAFSHVKLGKEPQ